MKGKRERFRNNDRNGCKQSEQKISNQTFDMRIELEKNQN